MKGWAGEEDECRQILCNCSPWRSLRVDPHAFLALLCLRNQRDVLALLSTLLRGGMSLVCVSVCHMQFMHCVAMSRERRTLTPPFWRSLVISSQALCLPLFTSPSPSTHTHTTHTGRPHTAVPGPDKQHVVNRRWTRYDALQKPSPPLLLLHTPTPTPSFMHDQVTSWHLPTRRAPQQPCSGTQRRVGGKCGRMPRGQARRINQAVVREDGKERRTKRRRRRRKGRGHVCVCVCASTPPFHKCH